MHELSLAGNVLDIVAQAAAAQGFTQVRVLRLSVPALAGVEVAALRFALDALAPGTALEAARIEIDQPPGRARCADCLREVELRDRLDPCPACGGLRLRVLGGSALRVVELLVPETADAVAGEDRGAGRCA
jgi:hydrogenase nickel incorporation protein HypA/HybF